jgi:hypothetical protein
MSNARLQQIISLLYLHKKLITSEGVNRICEELNNLTKRMYYHIDYYDNNETIKTSFDFFKKVVDKWFEQAYNDIT